MSETLLSPQAFSNYVQDVKKSPLSDEQLKSFAAELDALKAEFTDKIGQEDLAYMEMIHQVSRSCEIAGRLLLHFSRDPVSWGMGVLMLYVGIQLDNLEVHHTAQHGAFDKMPEAKRFHSDVYVHNSPVDEEAWRYRHNVLHHSYTGQVDRDPDVTYGYYRLSELIDKQAFHVVQPAMLILNTFNADQSVGMLSSGLMEFIQRLLFPGYAELKDYPSVNKSHDLEGFSKSLWLTLRKAVPNVAYNYGLFGLLAGPRWPQVTLGTLTAQLMRNIFTGVVFYTGHMTEGVKHYTEGPSNRAEWYLQQIEGTGNVQAGKIFSILAGHLNYQIEHHLFPKLTPNRLEEIAPRVQEICDRYGVHYETGELGEQLASVFRRLFKYSK